MARGDWTGLPRIFRAEDHWERERRNRDSVTHVYLNVAENLRKRTWESWSESLRTGYGSSRRVKQRQGRTVRRISTSFPDTLWPSLWVTSSLSSFSAIDIRISNAIVRVKKGAVQLAGCNRARETERKPGSRFRLPVHPSIRPEYPDTLTPFWAIPQPFGPSTDSVSRSGHCCSAELRNFWVRMF